jgi:hypothetical protein
MSTKEQLSPHSLCLPPRPPPHTHTRPILASLTHPSTHPPTHPPTHPIPSSPAPSIPPPPQGINQGAALTPRRRRYPGPWPGPGRPSRAATTTTTRPSPTPPPRPSPAGCEAPSPPCGGWGGGWRWGGEEPPTPALSPPVVTSGLRRLYGGAALTALRRPWGLSGPAPMAFIWATLV